MKLSEYYKMINEVSGQPVAEKDPRITYKDLSFDGPPGQQGSCTITFLDGNPIYLNWYIWSLDREWMYQQVEKELGKSIKLSNMSGGNGHEGADLEVIDE